MLTQHYLIDQFLFSARTVRLLALGCIVAVVVAAVVPVRRLSFLLVGLSLALVVAVTAPTNASMAALLSAGEHPWSTLALLHPTSADLTAWHTAVDGPLNVVLFWPLGASLTLLLRRPLLAWVVASGASLAIECAQAAAGTRVGSFADVVSNSLGAALGVGCAMLALGLARLAVGAARRPRSS